MVEMFERVFWKEEEPGNAESGPTGKLSLASGVVVSIDVLKHTVTVLRDDDETEIEIGVGQLINASTCDMCGELPDVDENDEYDLQQMCHAPTNPDGSTQWWCSECAGIEKFGKAKCPEEFKAPDGSCTVCDKSFWLGDQ